eukprot:CAMPEP_0185780848 /NCGR_PEP_ID=MMETSP1174-20130828/100353_1 /TAXON_ID=35687 /ORGANISM="Dictyocha speculum, Strain CCMP1381" /LENGTH=48 /DNA_ID= /DNA_START= /DNA_END= /DNA_ORIENTATION=
MKRTGVEELVSAYTVFMLNAGCIAMFPPSVSATNFFTEAIIRSGRRAR